MGSKRTLLVTLLCGCNSILGIDLPTDGGAEASGVAPKHSPEDIAFVDKDIACNEISGDVKITRSIDESDITGYALYWGTADGGTLSLITIVPKTGMDVTYALPATPIPQAAAQLRVFSRNAVGESATSVGVTIAEVNVVDISAGQIGGGAMPSAVIDTTNSKLLVAATDDANLATLALYRCALDGTGCTHTDLSSGQGPNSGNSPSIAIDKTNKKLLVVTANGASQQEKSALFRCDLDGSNCAYTDISSGQPAGAGFAPSLVIDPFNSKIIVANDYFGPPMMIRCDLDGSNCATTTLQNASGGSFPQALLDSVNQKLVVVRLAHDATLNVTHCDLDLTNCVSTTVDKSTGAGFFPTATLVEGRIYIAASLSGVLTLFATDPDGSKASVKTLGQAAFSPAVAYDVAGTGTQTSLDVIVANMATQPAVVRCDAKLTTCATSQLPQDPQGAWVGPRAVVDTVNHRLLVPGQNAETTLHMYMMCL